MGWRIFILKKCTNNFFGALGLPFKIHSVFLHIHISKNHTFSLHFPRLKGSKNNSFSWYELSPYLKNSSIASKTPCRLLHCKCRCAIGNAHHGTPTRSSWKSTHNYEYEINVMKISKRKVGTVFELIYTIWQKQASYF